ncbi:hypothetical protein ACIA8E_03440 [Streptomyces sp. NPDC051664]|uniref:hypothetical protein n=1 Tax=Streptomyces sp. NPDC051664 TaxID=3365668 RepID=UPI0037B59A20
MSMAGILLSAVVGVGALAIGIALQDWRPRPRRSDRSCPDCGDPRIRAVGSGNRLTGMLECRACHFVWSVNPAGG